MSIETMEAKGSRILTSNPVGLWNDISISRPMQLRNYILFCHIIEYANPE